MTSNKLYLQYYFKIKIGAMNTLDFNQVLAKDAYARYIGGEAMIIDVREHNDKISQPNMKALVQLPLSELESKISGLPTDKRIYILSGRGRSGARALQILLDAGFHNAKLIHEGAFGWEQSGLPLVQVVH